MLGIAGPYDYEIAVCGYTSDLGGKTLQREWYAIKVPDPDPDPDPTFKIYRPSIRERQIDPSSRAKGKELVKIDPPSEADPPSVKAKEKEKIDPSVKAKEKVKIETEPLDPFSVGKMMYQSTQHAFLELGHPYTFLINHLFSLGSLAPVGSDSDGDGVWSLEFNKPDAGWKEVPRMNFPNRYNPRSVAFYEKLYVFGGFSRSQFPAEAAAKGVGWMESYDISKIWKPFPILHLVFPLTMILSFSLLLMMKKRFL